MKGYFLQAILTIISVRTRATVYYSFLLYKANISTADDGYDTMADVWQIMIWMLLVLKSGILPAADWFGHAWEPHSWRALHAGQRISAQFIYTLRELIGDCEWLANCLHIAHWSTPNRCSWCTCNKTNLSFFDFRVTSGWLQLLYSDAYLAAHSPDHPLFTTPVCL